MASSSGNESENSTEETVSAPTRRTRSGRATAPKPSRRGRRRGGAPARSTRNTRKSARIQLEQEEELDEMLDQGQGSELDELKELALAGSTDDPLQFESGTVEPVFAELAGEQFGMQEEGDEEFQIEDTLEPENGLDSEQDQDEDEDDADADKGSSRQSANLEDDSSRDASKAGSDEDSREGTAPSQVAADSDSESNSAGVAEQPKKQLPSEDVEMAESSSDDASEPTANQEAVQTEASPKSTAVQQEEAMCVQETEVAMENASENVAEEESSLAEGAEGPRTEEASKTGVVLQEEETSTEVAPKIKDEQQAKVKEEPQLKEEPDTVPEKKRKRRGFSDAPAEEFAPPQKKQVKDEPKVNGDKGELKEEEDSSSEGGDKADKKRKALPELEKYWKAVREDASDFTGWTYLLQYVDQESDVEAAREAYDAFLSLYPYCYGYWRKYADYEKKKGSPENCDKVFERGLRAIPLSVDLWLHFLNHCKASHPGDDAFIRTQFERALSSCGMEFRSDRLWESYIKWETECKNMQNVTAIYDRLLATPTQGYTSHFDNFEMLAKAHLPQKLLSVDEFLALRKEWLATRRAKEEEQPAAAVVADAAEGTPEPAVKESEEAATVEQKQKEEIVALREKLIESRKEVHKATVAAVADRWNFEEGIKRPYFHVKPLEKSQLRNWREYLDFEIEQGSRQRIIVLFERCLIACALYEEFWVRFLQYMEGQKDVVLAEKIRNVYERACTIHHAKKANLHLHWAAFEEKELRGIDATENWERAAGILESLEKQMPGLLQLAYRRINLERRRGDLAGASALYESYVTSFKNQTISTNLAIKHARFCCKVKGDIEGAIAVLNKALDKDKANSRLYLQLIDMHMQRSPMDVAAVVGVFDRFLASEASPGNKATFAQRKLEFLEDFGDNISSVLKAQDEQQQHQKMAREAKKGDVQDKTSDSGSGGSSSKKGKHSSAEWTPPMPSQPPPPHPPSQYGAQGAAAQGYGGQAGGYAAQYGPQQGYAQQGAYNQAYPPQGGNSTDPNNYYQNWGGYGGYNQGWGNYNYY